MLAKKLFAPNFTPVFRASELAKFCNNRTRREKQEVDFVIKYSPFSKFKSKLILNQRKLLATSSKSYKLFPTLEDKYKIRKELKDEFSQTNSTKFNDQKVLQKIIETKTDDDDNNDIDYNNNDNKRLTNYLKLNFQKNQNSNSLLNEIRCERGRQLESNITDRLNIKLNMKFVLDGTDRLKEFDNMYIIKGRIDAVDELENALLEIKTRTRVDHSSNTMELKDRIQCLAYLNIGGFSRAILALNDCNGELKIFEIVYDENEFTKRIHLGLVDFVNKYRSMSENEFSKLVSKYYK